MTLQPERLPPLRLAACDVGSNATRLIIARVVGGDEPFLRREASYRVPLRLGDDVFTTGCISAEKAAGLVQIGKAFALLVDFFQPRALRACGTSALREADNRESVVASVRDAAHLPLELITGAEEARVLHASLRGTERSADSPRLYIDVGGGSTELTLVVNDAPLQSESFRIGCVRMLRAKVDAAEWQRLKQWLERLPHGAVPQVGVGTGGNIEQIASSVANASSEPLTVEGIHGYVASLEPLTLDERIRRYDLKPDRADVIVPAGKIYEQILRWAGIHTMLVPKVGLGDGLLNQMFDELKRDAPAMGRAG